MNKGMCRMQVSISGLHANKACKRRGQTSGHHAILCNPNWLIFEAICFLALSGSIEQFHILGYKVGLISTPTPNVGILIS